MTETFTFAMWLFTAIALLSLLALIAFARDQQRKRLLVGIQILQAGRIMLVHLQKHRGLTSARLSGITDKSSEILPLRDQVVADIAKLSALSDWLSVNENWQGMTSHWAGLSVNCETMAAEDCFDQHSRLVVALLQLLGDAANHFKVEENTRYTGTKVVWKEFLSMGEFIGQCRALGMQVLAGNLSADTRQKYREMISGNLVIISMQLERNFCISNKQKQDVELFIAFVKAQIFEGLGVVSASEYFNIASATIDMVYDQFDSEMQRFHRKISRVSQV
ncbi:nitrate- and nitrite sensing domain-containing protein [Teredinibacter haidensis]|uniref:nitrate- and nitrite sensing domain-containing protein n=1 Tax=Teredinibacter haidensis TaxID=2731755 RepID=UPI00094917F3|nr:nitrate- and nitrite sensing domain-containing protein [Teredinibacter haidensis]